MAQTLFEKIWSSHVVVDGNDNPSLLYIDRHLIHEVTSPQAFDGLRMNNRKVRRPDLTLATMDHNVPTSPLTMADDTSKSQINALDKNCKDFGIRLFDMDSAQQGIVHIIGPELGITLPGTTIVCGDSHTSTHGAFGSLAFGIGTSDVEHVLASQTLWMNKLLPFEISVTGKRQHPHAVTAKDIILSIIRNIGTQGGIGHVIEYRGDAIQELSMEQRMTICNMTIEGGARAGLIAPDKTTFAYIKNRMFTPENYDELVEQWSDTLYTDTNASFAKSHTIQADRLAPQVSWGTNPGMTCDITDRVPDPKEYAQGDEGKLKNAQQALEYMDLQPETLITDIYIDRVFLGSCTNARLEDLIEASKVVQGNKIAPSVKAMVVPGSQTVKREAEKLGLDKIFLDAGFEWRGAGCSMCLGMNPDILKPRERCASTSNRNFEGRQGSKGRTHLVSPVMAAAAAIEGHFVDTREIIP